MKRSLNLIPMKTLRKQAVSQVFRQWLCMALIGMAVTAIAVWWVWNQTAEQTRLLQAAQQQYAPLKNLEEETEALKRQASSLEKRERLALELSQNRSMLTLLGQLSSASMKCDSDVSISQMEMESKTTPAKPNEEAGVIESKLTLRGVGIDDVAIARFVAQLRDSQLFYDVQLTSTGSGKVGDKESKLYTVECVF